MHEAMLKVDSRAWHGEANTRANFMTTTGFRTLATAATAHEYGSLGTPFSRPEGTFACSRHRSGAGTAREQRHQRRGHGQLLTDMQPCSSRGPHLHHQHRVAQHTQAHRTGDFYVHAATVQSYRLVIGDLGDKWEQHNPHSGQMMARTPLPAQPVPGWASASAGSSPTHQRPHAAVHVPRRHAGDGVLFRVAVVQCDGVALARQGHARK